MRGSNGTPRKRGCIWKHSRLRRRWAGLLQRSCTNKEEMEQIFAINLTHNNDGYSGGGHKPQSAVRSEWSCRTWGRHNDNFWPCSTWWCGRALWVLETERWSDDTIKKSPFWMNKCRVYVTWPFLSLVQTTECQGTTSQQHGCKDPRLKPLELLRPDRRNTTLTMWLQRKVGFSYTSDEKRMVVFFQRGKSNTRIWGTAAEVGHRSRSTQKGSTVVNQHTINNQPSKIFHSPGCSPESSPMYCIVPHMVNARPPRFSRRESPKSDKRRWPEGKHILSVFIYTPQADGHHFVCTARLNLYMKLCFLPWSLTSTFSI